MIKVLKVFYDLKEGVFRSVGQEFEASKERGVAQADLVVSKLSIAIEFPSRIG